MCFVFGVQCRLGVFGSVWAWIWQGREGEMRNLFYGVLNVSCRIVLAKNNGLFDAHWCV